MGTESSGSVKHLDTSGFETACAKFEQASNDFREIVKEIQTTSSTLLHNWEGKGRKEFEYQYNILKGKFEDVTDDLYAIYDALLESEVSYSEVDDELAKAIRNAQG